MPSAARVFQVRFGPENPLSSGDQWPNNLQLRGEGTVAVTAEAVIFADARNAAPAARRSFALADVANVGHADDATGPIVAVRTSRDKREVLLWMASKEEASALLALLPRITTPQFVVLQEQHRKFQENMQKLAPKTRVTPLLIAANVVVFLALVAAGAGFVQSSGVVELRFGSDYGPLTWGGQPWRLITAAFIHFGVIHLAFNMYALFNGGSITERLYGSARFAVIYLLAALSGNVASGWWDATRNSAGASGAVFGVFGALLVFVWRRPADIPREILLRVRSGALLMCVYSLAMGVALPHIDNAAHVGGLLGGALAGLLLVRPFEPEARAVARPWRVLAVAAGLCALLAALAAPLMTSGIR
jgi:rhomboid protease GluP